MLASSEGVKGKKVLVDYITPAMSHTVLGWTFWLLVRLLRFCPHYSDSRKEFFSLNIAKIKKLQMYGPRDVR